MASIQAETENSLKVFFELVTYIENPYLASASIFLLSILNKFVTCSLKLSSLLIITPYKLFRT